MIVSRLLRIGPFEGIGLPRTSRGSSGCTWSRWPARSPAVLRLGGRSRPQMGGSPWAFGSVRRRSNGARLCSGPSAPNVRCSVTPRSGRSRSPPPEPNHRRMSRS